VFLDNFHSPVAILAENK